jgi:hypothetical protein
MLLSSASVSDRERAAKDAWKSIRTILIVSGLKVCPESTFPKWERPNGFA